MATVYKIELVSHWVNYSEEEIKKMVMQAIEKVEKENTIQVTVEKIR